MTALKKYQRLESTGLWRDATNAQRREVVVNFGEASLILSDPRTDAALSHWSLPAVERTNPGQLPAIYAPGPDAPETLEITDEEMIAALETVRGALAFARAKPGRLRAAILIGGTLLVLGVAVFVGPAQLVRQTALVVPEATRAQIGRTALAELSRITGQPCEGAGGQSALDRLAMRLFGPTAPWQLRILPDGVAGSANLPGHYILLNSALVESPKGPDAVAGFALVEVMRAMRADALEPLLHHAGLMATAGLMTSGTLAPTAVAGYGEVLLRAPPVVLDDAQILSAFELARIPSAPYAYVVDPTGETTLGLIEADPFRDGAPEPVMSMTDWATLQAICKS
jgi:hypothetical protein